MRFNTQFILVSLYTEENSNNGFWKRKFCNNLIFVVAVPKKCDYRTVYNFPFKYFLAQKKNAVWDFNRVKKLK